MQQPLIKNTVDRVAVQVLMELSAPFLAAYWPYIASLLVGVYIVELLRRVFQPQRSSLTVDVDPLAEKDVSVVPQADPLGFRVTSDRSCRYVPYLWFDDRLDEEEMLQKSAEFFEKMNRRRTVRKISEEDIPFNVVENIIKTAGNVTYTQAKKGPCTDTRN